ncbi:MAG: tyrosine-type recombinase/integrase, partial [candidate division Zixibacteria bacterium]|nr:tyrosine-type recombinase/integrase [candidate division Zixibacteria bacterium]
GYVLRRILRRASYHGRLLGLDRPFLSDVCRGVIEMMGPIYPEVADAAERISDLVTGEEERFLTTLEAGLTRLEQTVEAAGGRTTVLSGDEAFRLHDTFGFPLDLTRQALAARGWSVDEAGFERALEAQRRRGREALEEQRGEDEGLLAAVGDSEPTRFLGFDSLTAEADLTVLFSEGQRRQEANEGDAVEIVLSPGTPFYAEGGGQVGDAGRIVGENGTVAIEAVRRAGGGIFIHSGRVALGRIVQGERVRAEVDEATRDATRRNHTATHLLHRALRMVVGDQAKQAGSLVAPDRLRFDFLYNKPLTEEQLRRLLKTCDGRTFEERRDNAILRLFMDCGVRLSELAGLTLSDLDLDSNVAVVLGKGRRPRACPFGRRTTLALDRYLRARAGHRDSARPEQGSPHFFARGEPLAELDGWQPPCSRDPIAFSSIGYTNTHNDPLEFRRLPSTTEYIPPYSVCPSPYRWMREANFRQLCEDEHLDIRGPDDPKKEGGWVFEPDRQRALLKEFWSRLEKDNSLIFFYCNQGNPLDENLNRILVGVGRISIIGKQEYFGTKPPKFADEYPIWSRRITHDFQNEGFRLPYHEYLREGHDTSNIICRIPEGTMLDFSYVGEHVSDDTAVGALERLLQALQAVKDENKVPGDWQRHITWLNDVLSEVWKNRGPFPGAGSVLQFLGVEVGTAFAAAHGQRSQAVF